MSEIKIGLYEGKAMTNGEIVVGNLIYQMPPFAYILTRENYGRMIVTNDGCCTCKLTRVLSNSIKLIEI